MKVLIIHGYRGPITGGAYWLPNTTHELNDTDAAYLIDNGHARNAPHITVSDAVSPVVVVEVEPAEEVETPRKRRGNRS